MMGHKHHMYNYNIAFWKIALFFFFIGDIVTTMIGVSHPNITEGNPLYNIILANYGLWFMLFVLTIVKVIVVLCSYRLWLSIDGFHRGAIPFVFLLTGVFATFWNTVLIMVNTV